MSELPQGWSDCAIKDVLAALDEDGAILQQGWSPQCERLPAGDDEWAVLKTTAVQDGFFLENENKRLPCSLDYKPNIEVKAGDLLMTCAGPRSRCGVVCLVRKTRPKLMFSGKIYRFRPDPKAMDPAFFSLQLRTQALQLQIDAAKTGISESGLNMTRDRFFALRLQIPPIAEQKRIAQKLDARLAQVDTLKARIDAIPALLKRFRRAALSAMLSNSELPGVENWSTSSVADLCIASFDGPFGSKLKSDDYTDAGVRVVRLENIGHLNFVQDKLTYVSVEKGCELSKNRLFEGDILFSSFVDEEIRVCQLPRSKELFVNKADCFCLRVKPELADAKFLMLTLSTQETYQRVRESVHGATRPRINLSFLKSFEIRLPPLDEQAEIVRRVEQLFAFADQLEARISAAQKRIDALTQSLLAKAFRGELVPQDPNDEPASVLLERIRTQSAAAPKPRRGRKAAAN